MIIVYTGPQSFYGFNIGNQNVRYDRGVPSYIPDHMWEGLRLSTVFVEFDPEKHGRSGRPIFIVMPTTARWAISALFAVRKIQESFPGSHLHVYAAPEIRPLLEGLSLQIVEHRKMDTYYRTYDLSANGIPELKNQAFERTVLWPILFMNAIRMCDMADKTALETGSIISPMIQSDRSGEAVIVKSGYDEGVTYPELGAELSRRLPDAAVIDFSNDNYIVEAIALFKTARTVYHAGDGVLSLLSSAMGCETLFIMGKRWSGDFSKQYVMYGPHVKKISIAGTEGVESVADRYIQAAEGGIPISKPRPAEMDRPDPHEDVEMLPPQPITRNRGHRRHTEEN